VIKMSDFVIKEEASFGRYDEGVYLHGLEQDPRLYIGVIEHETLHRVLLEECKVPLEEQPEWLLDQIEVWNGFWIDM
jgi:hypothetical protein